MVEWSDEERAVLADVFGRMDYDTVGHEVLARTLIVYPWTMRYFANFGNLYNAEAIKTNAKIAAHGVVVTHGLDRGLKDLDNLKAVYAELGTKHSEVLRIDPDNFRLFSDCLTITVASKMGNKFTPTTQAILQKFLSCVVFALSRQYR